MVPNEEENKEIAIEDNKLLGKKKERDIDINYFSKDEAFENYEFKSKNISNDIELIKSYSKSLYLRLKESPIEIINLVVSPFTSFNDYFIDVYDKLLEKVQNIHTNKKKIIKYMYNNGVIHNEPVVFPSDSNNPNNNINNNNDNLNNDKDVNMNKNENIINSNDDNSENSNLNKNIINEVNPHYITLNSREIWTSIKEYKWEGIIKIIIIFGENGFIKNIIKNIDSYHNYYLILNLNNITQEKKAHFNNIIKNIYSFDDIIGFLKQDLYEHSTGKNSINEISEKFNEYNDLLKRYTYYNVNKEDIVNNDRSNLIYINFFNKNIININKEEIALFDPNSCSKSFICTCYTSKIKKNYNFENDKNIPNFLKPNYIIKKIGVELSISNNIYKILNNEYNEDNLNIHINNLTLNKKMIGLVSSILNKNNYNQEYIINNTLLNYAICDYICDLFNMKLYSNNINLNLIEIHLYEFTNYNIPYLIGKEYINNYKNKYEQDLLNSFSHFSFCISYGQLLIDNIKEYNGYIYLFDIYKNENDNNLNEEEYVNILKFFCYHKCNKYCELLGLNKIDINFYNINPDDSVQFKNKRICGICKKIFEINNKYNYNRDNLCLCFDCYNKIYESTYFRVCGICGNKFEYFYYLYILQKIEPPSLCKECEKIKINENNTNNDNNEDLIDNKEKERFVPTN